MIPFGSISDGRQVEACVLRNTLGMEVTLISFGAVIQSIRVPDASGHMVDVVLGFDTAEEYEKDTESFGAVVGRHANRIGGAAFTLDGRDYRLEANTGAHNLHSGSHGFQHCLWEVESESEDSVTFFILGRDMEQGFPGNLRVRVTYRLNDDNELTLSYEAVTDQATVINLTNHYYLNLSGHETGSMLDQKICIHADAFTAVADADSIPTGEIRSVDGTPMDLRTLQPIGDHINDSYDQLIFGNGYDHNYAFGHPGTMKDMAFAVSERSGIRLDLRSDRPGVQFYAGNFIPDKAGKGGARYSRRCGFCLETQNYPDAIHHPEFPNPVLRPGEVFRSTTILRFSVVH